MLQSITSAPHIYLDLEIDMTEAERCRQSIGRSMQAQGEPALSLTALIVRATAAAIELNPIVNAVFEEGALEGKDALKILIFCCESSALSTFVVLELTQLW